MRRSSAPPLARRGGRRRKRLLRVRFDPSPATAGEAEGLADQVEGPGRRLPPAGALCQLAPGRVDRDACAPRVADPGSALANGLLVKGAHRVAARASRRAPPRRLERRAGTQCRPPSPGGGRRWCRGRGPAPGAAAAAPGRGASGRSVTHQVLGAGAGGGDRGPHPPPRPGPGRGRAPAGAGRWGEGREARPGTRARARLAPPLFPQTADAGGGRAEGWK